MNAKELAEDLKARLAPGCERIEIAGSIRRGKPDPKDIELVCVPRIRDEAQEIDLWGQPVGALVFTNLLYVELEKLFAYGSGTWTLDPDLPRNGPKYKRLRYWGGKGICCDLFIVSAATWGAQMVIRTGPGDFSKAIVTRAQARGMKQDDGLLWRIHRDDTRTVIDTPEERDYFAALGLPYLEPAERSVRALMALSMRAKA